ncbi:type II toxin-antitoxin system RelE/ParE family toxin [Rhizomicrobium electricum]|uniref:Type II toxin-antitoxin system RelE/ParE family toxin n=1 Tax=Rhizomicrobium electricum TaxID=480070 RepID=A0ABN1ENJ7_9PROT|nr:type II toxin-antitoxin system RelE/ParE family toxin [Rhizomicrobium electricum]NIJ46848.1 toxin ParE1/3/4 [Rhizomicrobium electricum]
MKEYQVVFAPNAEQDLDDLYCYIADHSGLARAEDFVGELVQECLELRAFPERGSPRSDIRPNLRTTSYARRVTIAYSVDQGAYTVAILGIFYGGRDFAHLLKGDDPK